jgi:hypothetical protein
MDWIVATISARPNPNAAALRSAVPVTESLSTLAKADLKASMSYVGFRFWVILFLIIHLYGVLSSCTIVSL